MCVSSVESELGLDVMCKEASPSLLSAEWNSAWEMQWRKDKNICEARCVSNHPTEMLSVSLT